MSDISESDPVAEAPRQIRADGVILFFSFQLSEVSIFAPAELEQNICKYNSYLYLTVPTSWAWYQSMASGESMKQEEPATREPSGHEAAAEASRRERAAAAQSNIADTNLSSSGV